MEDILCKNLRINVEYESSPSFTEFSPDLVLLGSPLDVNKPWISIERGRSVAGRRRGSVAAGPAAAGAAPQTGRRCPH